MSSNDSKMRCRCSQPPPLPTPPREQYAVIILCQPVLGSSPRQFVFPIPKIIRSQLCSPLPCRCRRSGRGAVAARHTATACAGRARPASRPHGTYEQQLTQSALQAVIGRCGGDNLPRPSVGQSTLHPPYLQIDRS